MSAHRVVRLAAAAAVALAAPLSLPPPSTSAAGTVSCPAPLHLATTVSPPGGKPFQLCSGKVPSFDGTPLDVDVSIPSSATGPRPLMVLLHGWGNSKTEWESTTLEGNDPNRWHWNNAWFASQGYTVLNYSARGFKGSCGKDPASLYVYVADPACLGRASWTHLSDRRWEVHDTQYLAGLLVDEGVATPKVSVSGGSYGGGQAWLMALSQDRVVDPGSRAGAVTSQPWRSPRGTPLHLAAALPEYPWTDLASALVPNGRASDGFHGAPPPGPSNTPFGVMKQTYDLGLFALGEASAQYALPGVDPTADLTTWFASIGIGEPYEINPPAQAALAEVGSELRSPLAMPIPTGGNRAPVYFIQGNTDPLFPAYQGQEQMNRLRAADPSYPVWSFYGDIGHSYAQNEPAVWHQFNDGANNWLTTVLAGSVPTRPRETLTTTQCVPGQSLTTFTSSRYDRIAQTVLHLSDPSTKLTVSAAVPLPEGVQTDPIVNSGCRSIATRTDPGVAAYAFTQPSTFTLTGAPVVHASVTALGPNAELAARLWDVDPTTGKQTLVTRSVYRIVAGLLGGTQPIAFELWPNAWRVGAGHQLKLELTQDDSPVWRPDNLPSALTISGLRLDLPGRAG
ncbi:MAG: CocE/NonD family hydrolase C-terminal non-catalytic domain-containing protein [Candidatus Dormibacteria bacterium]